MEELGELSNLRRVCIDFTAGFVSGVVSLYVGHPLDTIKVRMQVTSGERCKGSLGIFKSILAKEGVRGLFKGALPPVLGNAPVNAVLFASNDVAKRTLKDVDLSEETKVFCGGCFGGLMCCLINCPIELLKVKKQGNVGRTMSYTKIIRAEGFNGLFSAFVPILWRDVPTYGIYFFTYNYLAKKLCEKQNPDRKSIKNTVGKMVAGGLSGLVIWTISFPFDAIKSYIQYHPGHRGTFRTARYIYRKYGAGKFYRGLAPCLIRAFPVNAIVFITYEETVSILNNYL
ncbi:unnamed protein product [Moneuplotes crassus]|uniref:Mitochondrial carrier protein n=1 Tax=Euplotes crassus TaxID=5936 RepID=A0AAD1XQS8_EUPCR|nr:unnamed protein product [Moneuplotes crassus]